MKLSNNNLPLFLTNVIPTLTANQVLTFPNQASYLNPFGTGMWVDEIQVGYDNATTASAGPANLWVELELGRYKICDLMPAWLLGKDMGSGQDSAVETKYSLRLRHPLWLEPGQWISPTVQHKALAGTASMTNVRVSVLGRSSNERPMGNEPQWRPWLSSYVGTPRLATANFTESSTNANIYNPFPRPLAVEMFTGRVSVNGYDSGSDNLTAAPNAGCATLTGVRAYNSNGVVLARDLTPFDLLFTCTSKAWDVNTQLQQNGFYRFFLNEAYASINNAETRITPMIGMISYQLDPNWRTDV